MDSRLTIDTIPAQIVNEQAAFGPLDLKTYLYANDGETIRFQAELQNGQPLPQGLICTGDGIVTGIPAKNTEGSYQVIIIAHHSSGTSQAEFTLTIKSRLSLEGIDIIEKAKAQIWEALDKNLVPPDLSSLINLPITGLDIYYLLERFSTLKIWDAFNLDPPGNPKPLNLKGMSEHYQVYDRGCCLVAVPKDLFSHERTLVDGLMTARAMAQEVYKRNWTVELVGFDKLTRAAWVEIQSLGDKHGKQLEVVNFDPTPHDIDLYRKNTPESGM